MRAFAVLLLALSAAAIMATAGNAQVGNDINKPYVCFERSREIPRPTPDAPLLVNATLQRYPMAAFRLCSDRWGDHYFLRTPERVVGGVCVFDEREVFPSVDPNSAGAGALAANAPDFVPTLAQPPKPWGTEGPLATWRARFMAVQQAGCPPLERRRYIAVDENITAGDLIRLRDTWLSPGQSEEAFASFAKNLPEGCDPFLTGFPAAVQKRVYDSLRTSLHSFLFDRGTSLYVASITKRGDSYHVDVNDRYDPVRLTPFSLSIAESAAALRVTCLAGLYVA